jgi:hypothetical protein
MSERMDVDDDDVEPVPKKQRKKKEKKVWPVGSNGLKKKRTVKRKMTTDEKGYTGLSLIVGVVSELIFSSSPQCSKMFLSMSPSMKSRRKNLRKRPQPNPLHRRAQLRRRVRRKRLSSLRGA